MANNNAGNFWDAYQDYMIMEKGSRGQSQLDIAVNYLKSAVSENKNFVFERGFNGTTPLQTVCSCPSIEAAKILIDAGSPVGFEEFNIVVSGGDQWDGRRVEDGILILEELLKHGVDVNERDNFGKTFLFEAKNAKTVEFLLKHEVDPNVKDADGYTALHHAVMNQNPAVVKTLIDAGADVNVRDSMDGYTPLLSARATGDILNVEKEEEMVRLLLNGGADVNVRSNAGETALHFYMDGPIAKILLTTDADVNQTDYKDNTPLHFARDSEAVSALIERGAEIESRNQRGYIPLISLANYGWTDSVKTMIGAGADLEATNNDGETALLRAVCFGRATVAEKLIDAGANLEILNENGLNLLQVAITAKAHEYEEKISTVKVLLKAGIDPRKPDSDGDSPLDYAKAGGNQEVINLVESKAQELTMKEKHGITNDRPRSRGRGQEL